MFSALISGISYSTSMFDAIISMLRAQSTDSYTS